MTLSHHNWFSQLKSNYEEQIKKLGKEAYKYLVIFFPILGYSRYLLSLLKNIYNEIQIFYL